MKNKWLKQIFNWKHKKPTSQKRMEISFSQVERMLQMIQKTQEIELSCDDVQGLLDQYTEMAMRGEDVVAILPLVHHHLTMCPDCREEYEALTRILESQMSN